MVMLSTVGIFLACLGIFLLGYLACYKHGRIVHVCIPPDNKNKCFTY